MPFEVWKGHSIVKYVGNGGKGDVSAPLAEGHIYQIEYLDRLRSV